LRESSGRRQLREDLRVHLDLADTSPSFRSSFPCIGAVLGHYVITQSPGAPIYEAADPTLPPDTRVRRHAPGLSSAGWREQLVSLRSQQNFGTVAGLHIVVLSCSFSGDRAELDKELLDRQVVSGFSVATIRAPRGEDEARRRIEPCRLKSATQVDVAVLVRRTSQTLLDGKVWGLNSTTLADFRAGPRPAELMAPGMGEALPLDLGS
jgi:hypothetical protein